MSEAQRLAILITADGGAYEAALRECARATEGLMAKLGNAGSMAEGVAKRAAAGWGDLASAGSKLGLALGSVAAVGATAAAGLGAAWFTAASQANQAVDDLRARLGVTANVAEGFGDLGREVFANNWGADIGEATAAVGQLAQAFQFDLPRDQLAQTTQAAFALRDVMGVELEQSTRLASNMYTTFGTEGSAAFDILTASMQRAGPAGEDMLDSFIEYSDHFARLGFSAQEMGGMLTSAVQAGAWNTDVAGDAIKEFGIRISDGTLLSKAALDSLPASVTGVAAAFNSGAVDGEAAFHQILDAIASIEDPMMRYQAGVLAFGTKWEDVGEKAMLSMAFSAGALGDTEGAALAAGNAINQNIGAAWEGVKRSAMTALTSLGGSDAFAGLEAVAISALGGVQGRLIEFGNALSSADEWSSSFGETVTTSLGGLLGIDLSGLTGTIDGLAAKWADVSSAFQAGGIQGALAEIVGFDLQPLADGWNGLKEAVQPLVDAVASVASKFTDFAGGPGQLIATVVGTTLVIAFGALAAAALSAAAGVIAAMLPILVPIAAVSLAVIVLRKAWETNWGGIRDKTAAIVAWFGTSVVPVIQGVWDRLREGFASLVAWWQENGDAVIGYLRGLWNIIAGIFEVGWALVKGIFAIGVALITGNFTELGPKLFVVGQQIVAGIGRVLSGLWGVAKAAFALLRDNAIPFLKMAGSKIGGALVDGLEAIVIRIPSVLGGLLLGVGKGIVDGIKSGVQSAWSGFLSWFGGKTGELESTARKELDEHSPSRVFIRIGQDAVAGLAIGFSALGEVAVALHDGLGRMIGQLDVESVEQVRRLTSALIGVFSDAAQGIRMLLDFDLTASAEQISGGFDRLVKTFETAMLRMKGLAQYAGRGAPQNQEIANQFLNMFDIENITRWAGGVKAGIDVIGGMLDVVRRLGDTKLPSGGAITGLVPYLEELAGAAIAFTEKVASDAGGRWLEQGAAAAAQVAAFVKSAAEIAGLKIDVVSADLVARVGGAADAAVLVLDRIRVAAAAWIGIDSVTRDRWSAGIKGFVEAATASAGLLKAATDLKIDEATLATTAQIDAAARVGNDALTKIAGLADFWIRWAEEMRDNAVSGIRSYVDAGTAAIGLLKAGAEMDLSKATEANVVQLGIAGRNAQLAESLVRALAAGFITAGDAWRELVVPAVKEWSDSSKASIDILTAGAALAIDKVVEATLPPLAAAGRNASTALALVHGLAQGYINMGAAQREKVVPAIKDWADSAGASLKLLVDAAGVTTDWSKVTAFLHDGLARAGDNASAMLSVVQQLATTWAGASDNAAIGAVAERVKIWADGAGSALRILVDAAGVTTDWAKVQIVSVHHMTIAGVNALLMLRAVSQLADVWAGIAAPEVLRALVDRVKLFAEGAGTALRLIVDIAGLAVDWSKVTLVSASGLDAVGANASLLLAAAERLSADWVSGRSAEDMKATSERIKLWGDSASGAGKAFADAAGSFSALVKAKWPADLSGAIARVGLAMSAVLAEFSDMYDRLRRGGRDLDKAGQISLLVGGAAESVGKVFEAFSLEKLLKNPLVDSKVRSGWASQVAARRLDHLAGKMAEGVRRAVTALIDGLAGVVVPSGLASGLDALVSVYERLLDTLERLSAATLPDASKIAALLAALGYVPGMPGAPAGGSSSGGPPSMGSPYQPPAPPPSMGPPYQPPAAPGQPSLPPVAPGPGPAPAVTVQLTNEVHLGLEVVARALTLVSNVKAMQTTHAPVGA